MTATNAPAVAPAGVAAREPGRPWSYAEAADFLGVCGATVARACRDARIKSIAFGRRRLIPDDELRRVAREGF